MPILCAASCKYLSIDSNLYVNVIYISVWITFCSLQHFAPSKNIICRNLVVLFGPNSTFIIRIKTNTAHTHIHAFVVLPQGKTIITIGAKVSLKQFDVSRWNSFDYARITEMNKHAKITQYTAWKKQLKYSSCWHRICLRCSRFAFNTIPFSRYPPRAGKMLKCRWTNNESEKERKRGRGGGETERATGKAFPLKPWHLCECVSI